jgi:myosin heavy subunit
MCFLLIEKMRYFAMVDLIGEGKSFSRSHSSELSHSASSPPVGTPKRGGSSEVEEAVLSTNPIMESFGITQRRRETTILLVLQSISKSS